MTNLPNKPLIYDLDISQIEHSLALWSEPVYRASQIWNGLYVNLWNNPEQFTNLPLQLRNNLETYYSFSNLALSAKCPIFFVMHWHYFFNLYFISAINCVFIGFQLIPIPGVKL